MTHSDSANAAGNSLFDKVAGKAKEVVGNVIGDETLAEEGELQQRKAETAKTAADLNVEADQRQAEADLKAEVEANRIEQQRVATELAQRTREQQLESEKERAEALIEQQAAQREVAIERQQAIEEQVLDNKAADVVVDLVDGAADAAEIDREAQRAAAAADALKAAQLKLEQR